MSTAITVSIVIPIRNRASLFKTTVDSLRHQTYPHWEAILVDDGSSTEQYQRIAAIASADARIHPIENRGPRSGACACRNLGLGAATGAYVIFLDSDDALAPDCLAQRLAAITTAPEAGFVVFPSWYFQEVPGDSTALWNVFDGTDDIERLIAGDSPWQTSGPIWRRDALVKVGPWDERLRSWQDTEFHLRALIIGVRYQKIAVPDSYWRSPGGESSIGARSRSPEYVFNRARMLGRIGVLLRDHGKMTRTRRQAMSLQFFRHAFQTRLPRRHALAIWRLGRQLRLVSHSEYWTGLFLDSLERVARRASRRGLRQLYPAIERPLRFGSEHYSAQSSPPSARQ